MKMLFRCRLCGEVFCGHYGDTQDIEKLNSDWLARNKSGEQNLPVINHACREMGMGVADYLGYVNDDEFIDETQIIEFYERTQKESEEYNRRHLEKKRKRLLEQRKKSDIR